MQPATSMTEGLLREARGWLRDCGLVPMPTEEKATILAVHMNYDGGWPAFVAADPDLRGREPEVGMAMAARYGRQFNALVWK